MEIKNVYPPLKRKLNRRRKLRTACGWCFLAAAAACVIVNICVGGKAWSAVALWALWMIWSTLLTPVLVENNLISQSARLLINTCILLILIDLTISSGWAAFVIPIVCYGMLIAIGIIFFLNVSKQRQNKMPMLWVIAGAIVAAICAIFGFSLRNWPIIVLGSIAAALLIATIVILRSQLFAELKKHFHH